MGRVPSLGNRRGENKCNFSAVRGSGKSKIRHRGWRVPTTRTLEPAINVVKIQVIVGLNLREVVIRKKHVAESRTPIEANPAESAVDPAPRRASRWQIAGRALRHRNFQLFFSGQLISLIGTWMQSVAQSWLVYRLDRFGVAAGGGGIRQPDSCVFICAVGRNHGRSLQPPPHGHWNPGRVDAAGFHSGGAHPAAQGAGLACICAGGVFWEW